MTNLSHISERTLRVWRRRAAKQAEKKMAVMKRHKPGTSWYTRARLEYQVYRSRVEKIDIELSRRD